MIVCPNEGCNLPTDHTPGYCGIRHDDIDAFVDLMERLSEQAWHDAHWRIDNPAPQQCTTYDEYRGMAFAYREAAQLIKYGMPYR